MKAQSQIVSALIIVILSLVIVGTVFSWAANIIQKKKDSKSLDDVYQFFQELDSTITNVARNGGEESITIEVPGIITVYPEDYNLEDSNILNNSIAFKFSSRVSSVAAIDDWIPLNTPNNNTVATLGVDKPSVIFGKGSREQDTINIWYRLWFRQLEDKSIGKRYKIALKTSDGQEKTTSKGFLRVQRLGSVLEDGRNLIITQINIIV